MIPPWLLILLAASISVGVGVWIALTRRGRRGHSVQKSAVLRDAVNLIRGNHVSQVETETGREPFSSPAYPSVESPEAAATYMTRAEVDATACSEDAPSGDLDEQTEAMNHGLAAGDSDNVMGAAAPPFDGDRRQDSHRKSVINPVVTDPEIALDSPNDATYKKGPPTTAAPPNGPVGHDCETLECVSEDSAVRARAAVTEPDVAAKIDDQSGDMERFTTATRAVGDSSHDESTQTAVGTKARDGIEALPRAKPHADQQPASATEKAHGRAKSKEAENTQSTLEAGPNSAQKSMHAQLDANSRSVADQTKCSPVAPAVDGSQSPSEPGLSSPGGEKTQTARTERAGGASHAGATQTIVQTKPRDDMESATGASPTKSTVHPGPTAAEQVDSRTPPETDPIVKEAAERRDTCDKKRDNSTPGHSTVPVYRPPVRTAETTRRSNRELSSQKSNGILVRSFPMFVRVVFARSGRNRCRVSLLPSRTAGQDEEIEVFGPDGTENWAACQDEWYSDVIPSRIATLLLKGARWDCVGDKDLRWVLSGREIWVLAQSPTGTINGFVSVPRLILQENHLVLCREEQREAVLKALLDAGCNSAIEVDGDGLPAGWILIQDVQPTNAIHHEESVGIFNVLRPVHKVAIVFEGGIRLSRANWLNGYPPRIRVRGAGHDVDVLIDQQPASVQGSAGYVAPGWDAPGFHTVFCGGVAESYQLVDGVQRWARFAAFVYRPTWDETDQRAVVVCGPIVKPAADHQAIALTPAANTCYLGKIPGQIAFSAQPYAVRQNECVAIAAFPIVWTLPADPLRSDKSQAAVRLLEECCVNDSGGSSAGNRETVLRWCKAILDSARKRLLIEPNNPEAKKLWDQYKRVARRLWKELR